MSESYDAQKEFSLILSKAAHRNRDLRVFLKNEALKQFDYDYDVFYPLTKDKVVSGSKTFREILLDYCDNEKQLERIERELPLLNILIPDLTWVDEDLFSAENWDVDNEEVAVAYSEGNDNNSFFEDGKHSFDLESKELPTIPVLIVKNNERMVYKPSTRSVEPVGEYDFFAEEFDNTKPKTKKNDWRVVEEEEYPVEDLSSYVNQSDLEKYSKLVIPAYNEFGANSQDGLQRDNIYYGMTKTNTNAGKLNIRVREGLYRFRFTDIYNLSQVCDDHTPGQDPTYEGTYKFYESSNKGACLDNFFGLITDGKLEIVFEYYYGVVNAGVSCMSKPFTINIKDLIQVKKYTKRYKNKTMNNHRKWKYYVEYALKWYYPKGAEFFNWDLGVHSTQLSLHVYEKDSKATETRKKVEAWTFASSVNASGEVGSDKGKASLGIKIDSSKNGSSEVSYTVQTENNDFGWSNVDFADDIITGKSGSRYSLREYYLGSQLVYSLVPYI